jgi:dihydroorotate dehydrogenase
VVQIYTGLIYKGPELVKDAANALKKAFKTALSPANTGASGS